MGRLLLPLLQKLLVWVGSKIMVALGLGFITYKGFETAFDMITNYVVSNGASFGYYFWRIYV